MWLSALILLCLIRFKLLVINFWFRARFSALTNFVNYFLFHQFVWEMFHLLENFKF